MQSVLRLLDGQTCEVETTVASLVPLPIFCSITETLVTVSNMLVMGTKFMIPK